jgi:hypothetical protein
MAIEKKSLFSSGPISKPTASLLSQTKMVNNKVTAGRAVAAKSNVLAGKSNVLAGKSNVLAGKSNVLAGKSNVLAGKVTF